VSDVTAPSLLILGTDTVLAVPATAVQLAHACLAAGYEAVIPATWGDELIAAHALRRIQDSDDPLVLCACPFVSQRLVDDAAALAPTLVRTASPPVATALYLRELYSPGVVHITYAGACPGGADESIDVHVSPQGLLDELASRGIDASLQPTEFDSIIPPDRRRFYSEPGGMLSRSALRLRDVSRDIRLNDVNPDDLVIALAQQLLERSSTLVDVAPALGCVCSGAVATRDPQAARSDVRAVEPPRASSPILDHSISIAIERSDVFSQQVPHLSDAPPPHVEPRRVSAPVAELEHAEELPAPVATAPRRSPPGTNRAVLGVMPQARTEPGRQLPRAYIARRRSTPRNLKALGSRHSGATASTRQTRLWWWLVIGLLVVGSGVGALSVFAGP
jgi:hypothetical protein